jgi:hypothetical protein
MNQDTSEDPRIVRLQEEIADLRLVLGYFSRLHSERKRMADGIEDKTQRESSRNISICSIPITRSRMELRS